MAVKPTFKPNLLDRVIQSVSPSWGAKRAKSKMFLGALESVGYNVPGSSKRSMRGWFTSGGSANADTLLDLDASRSGSRDLYMNTPIATAILRRLSTNVVGSGLNFQSRLDPESLGITSAQAILKEKEIEREWKLWSTSKDCDITRTSNFNQLQYLAFLSAKMSGDVFVLLPHKKIKNNPYSLRIQLIEGDQVSNPDYQDDPTNERLQGGIQTDVHGAPEKIWVRTTHPGGIDLESKWIPISIYGKESGRKNILHIFDKERPGQYRGMPFLAPVLDKLKMLTRLSEAELMASLVTAFFTVFIKTDSGTDLLSDSILPGDRVTENDDDADQKYELGNGSMVSLNERESIDIADPNRPNAAFEPFFNAIVKEIGAAVELAPELILLCFEKSYSSSRGAMLESWKTFRKEIGNFTINFNQPVVENFITEAVITGRLNLPGFLTDPLKRSAWCGSKWSGAGQGQLDPLKETQAAAMRIEKNLSSYEDESQKIAGGDWESNMTRKQRETQFLKDKGLFISEEATVEKESEKEDDDE